MSDDPDTNYQMKYAFLAFERDARDRSEMLATAIATGTNALRAVNLISGGSVVVGLAFVGSVYSSNPQWAQQLMLAIMIFAIAAVFSGAASGFTYLSQALYAKAAQSTDYSWEHPFVKANDEWDAYQKKGDIWRGFAVLSVVLAYLLVLAGLCVFWYSIPSPS